MIERAARDPSVDIDRMERLFTMHEQAEARRAKAAFFAALSELQANLPPAVRRGTGHNNKAYARFEDVVEALRPKLKQHEFSITYRVRQPDGKVTIVGVLAHAMGHTEETEITLPHDTSGSKNPVQALASSVSYGKRYVTLTLTGIATDDDDDGKSAGTSTITAEQAAELAGLVKETEASLEWICERYEVPELSYLTAAQYAEAKAGLLARRRARVRK